MRQQISARRGDAGIDLDLDLGDLVWFALGVFVGFAVKNKATNTLSCLECEGNPAICRSPGEKVIDGEVLKGS